MFSVPLDLISPAPLTDEDEVAKEEEAALKIQFEPLANYLKIQLAESINDGTFSALPFVFISLIHVY